MLKLKLEHEYLRSIALISDTHVGSRFGLCPEKYVSVEEDTIAPNRGQRQILESFRDYSRRMRDDFKIDTVFLVGDMMAGLNIKEFGVFMKTTDMNEQVEMATQVLNILCKGKRVAVWSGTPYHEARDFRIHQLLADNLGGKFYGSISNMRLEPTSKIVNVAHATTQAMVYPETVLSRDILFLKEGEALGKLYKTSAIIRGHRHSYVEIHKSDLHYISLPCWEAFTPYYKATQWYFKFQPDIGGALMMVDVKERLRFMHFLYPCPKIADRLVSG